MDLLQVGIPGQVRRHAVFADASKFPTEVLSDTTVCGRTDWERGLYLGKQHCHKCWIDIDAALRAYEEAHR